MRTTIKVTGFEELQLQLAAISMPAKKRKRFMWRLGNEVKKKSKANIRAKQNPNKTKWKPKKSEKNGKRLFKKIPSYIAIKAEPEFAQLYFSNKDKKKFHPGVIAKQHEKGATVNRDKAQHKAAMERKEKAKGIDEDSKATSRQAKYLVKLKMKRKIKSKSGNSKSKAKLVRVTKSWIEEKMSYKQAQVIINILQNKKKSNERTWKIKLPKRDILGVTKAEQTKIFNRVMQGINYGWKVKKQDMKS